MEVFCGSFILSEQQKKNAAPSALPLKVHIRESPLQVQEADSIVYRPAWFFWRENQDSYDLPKMQQSSSIRTEKQILKLVARKDNIHSPAVKQY